MKKSLKKRGQKLAKKFSRASLKASEGGRDHIRENLIQRISHIRDIRLLITEWVLMAAALVMLAVAQAFWFGESYAESTFVDGGSYTEATLGRVNSLNPLFATTSSEKTLSRLMFATISTVDYSGHVGLGLARSIRASEDGQVWKVTLRDGLRWSDGEPLTNDDVLFTIDLIQNPAVNTVYTSNLASVEVTESAEGELVFTLPGAYEDFISALEIPVVPKHILENAPAKTLVEDEFSSNPVTSGAFMLNATQATTSAVADDERIFYLSGNPNYYAGAPMLSSFAVHTYATRDDIVSAVNSGAVTATAELSELEADRVTAGNFERRDSEVNAGVFAFFNMSREGLAKVAVRAALRQGIDLAQVRAAAPGTAALDYPLLASQIELESYPVLPKYDLAAAKAKLAEATGGEKLHLNIATVNSGYLPAVAEALAEQLRTMGVESGVTAYAENQDFVTNVIAKRNYDILVYDVELGADPDPLPYYHSSQAGAAGLNLSGYHNALVDDLLVGARETLDEDLRARKYESFLEYWVNDVPAVGLYQSNMTYIYNKNTRPYSDEVRLTTPLDRFSDITSWAAAVGTKNKTP